MRDMETRTSPGRPPPPRPMEPEPRLPRRHVGRPAAYALLGTAVVLALVTIVLAVRLGFRLADASRDESAFSGRDPVLLLLLGTGSLVAFRLAERLGDF